MPSAARQSIPLGLYAGDEPGIEPDEQRPFTHLGVHRSRCHGRHAGRIGSCCINFIFAENFSGRH
jgi:hypothetical protein